MQLPARSTLLVVLAFAVGSAMAAVRGCGAGQERSPVTAPTVTAPGTPGSVEVPALRPAEPVVRREANSPLPSEPGGTGQPVTGVLPEGVPVPVEVLTNPGDLETASGFWIEAAPPGQTSDSWVRARPDGSGTLHLPRGTWSVRIVHPRIGVVAMQDMSIYPSTPRTGRTLRFDDPLPNPATTLAVDLRYRNFPTSRVMEIWLEVEGERGDLPGGVQVGKSRYLFLNLKPLEYSIHFRQQNDVETVHPEAWVGAAYSMDVSLPSAEELRLLSTQGY